jgi:hypothetical protein
LDKRLRTHIGGGKWRERCIPYRVLDKGLGREYGVAVEYRPKTTNQNATFV